MTGLAKLTATFRSSAGSQVGDALEAAWRDVLTAKPWISRQIFEEAVQETLLTPCEFLPTVGQFVEVCAVVRHDQEREQERVALPPPPRRAADAVDPHDPYSCTPEERERWAREDAWIRAWRTTLPPPSTPEALAGLSAADREYVLDYERRNWGVAGWPTLTPAARRAKERRIEAERDRAMAALLGPLGRAGGVPERPAPEVGAPR